VPAAPSASSPADPATHAPAAPSASLAGRTGTAARSLWLPSALAVLSGLLLFAAFPPLDRGLLAWVALVPLLLAVQGRTPRVAFRLGYLAGWVWFGLLLSWITLFGIATWVVLVAVMALYPGLFAWAVQHLARRRPHAALWLAPLLWTAVEVVRAEGPLAFPWGFLGVSQHRVLPALQLAALGGVHLVSLAVVLGNVLVVTLVRRPVPWRPLVAAGFLLAAGLLVGTWRAGWARPAGPVAAALQPNVPPLLKGDAATRRAQLDRMRELTVRAARDGAALIVFPESAVPVNLFGPGGAVAAVAAWAPERVVVATSLEVGTTAQNSAAVLAGGRVWGRYAKRRLVPFGEAGITPGRWTDPVATPLGRVGVAVCYESAFALPSLRAAQRGAAVLVVVTNDGWFGRSAGPAQHAAFAVVRAVETGRSVVRAANTGISLIVDPLGRVQASLGLDRAGVVRAPLSAPVATPYLRGGWLVAPAALAAALLLLLPLREAVGAVRGDPGLRRLGAALLLPGALVLAGLVPVWARGEPAPLWPPGAGDGGVAAWVLPPAVAAASAAFGVRLAARSALASAALGSAVVLLFGGTLLGAFGRYGIPLRLAPPAAGWGVGGAQLLLAGVAWELWLRGAVFEAARAWRGPAAAVALSALPALLLAGSTTQEAMLWALLTGVLFGLIRWLTGDAVGLALPRAAGFLLLAALPGVRL